MKIIPIFIPHAGCPYKCIYCDQHKISGVQKAPSIPELRSLIDRNLKTIPKNEKVEVAFFGGTFTLLPNCLQRGYLEAVYPYVKDKKLSGIRMSTHPEAVSESSMRIFKKMGGCMVELGIQSLDKEVLEKAGRKMSFKAVQDAVRRIKKASLQLGVQVMLGLPGDTLTKSIRTARKIIKFKPSTARIYPAIILKGTDLERLLRRREYKPLKMEEAIEWASKISSIFEENGVKVIRIGLHPSEDLNSLDTVIGGPYHPAFGEMVRARQMRNKIIEALGDKKVPNRSSIEIYAPKNKFSFITGHKGEEKRFLERAFGAPIVLHEISMPPHLNPSSFAKASEDRLPKGERIEHKRPSPFWGEGRVRGKFEDIKIFDKRKPIAIIDPRMPDKAKEKLRKMGYYTLEVTLHKKLAAPIKGHVDMMLFSYKNKVIYEQGLEKIAELLRDNGYECIRGKEIASSKYPADIIYNACAVGEFIIRYNGRIEKNIEGLKAKFIKVEQGYTKCSIVAVGDKHIITSDKDINDKWNVETRHASSLHIRHGYVKLPGHKTGFIGGAAGVDKDKVFFVGSLKNHPDGFLIRDFIKKTGKNIIELYDGLLYDVGSILFFEARIRRICN